MNIRLSQKKPGFTLLEVLIAATIFSIISMLATSIFVNLSQNKQQITSRNLLYDDAQFILDQLSRQIASNTVDYEEYYNQLILGGSPGMNFGHYASQFYYNVSSNKPYKECVDYDEKTNTYTPKKSCINTGKHPSDDNSQPDNANAFFSGSDPKTDGIFCDGFSAFMSSTKHHVCVKQLFLINGEASRKTMIAKEKLLWDNVTDPSYVLSQLAMKSYEYTDKTNLPTVIPRLFTCVLTNCSQATTPAITPINYSNTTQVTLNYPDSSDLESTNEVVTATGDQEPIARAYASDYIPFTPSRVNIKDIKFFISPVEDPHKAFAEPDTDPTHTYLHQPSITIVMTVEPISNVRYNTKHPSVTVQTSVTPGLFAEVLSYPPQMVKTP